MSVHGGATGGAHRLAEGFSGLAHLLAQESERLDPARLLDVATTVMPHAEFGAITVIEGLSRPRTIVSTGPVPDSVDRIQYATGQGPCLDATTADGVTLVQDLRIDTVWPQFARRCVEETPVRSMMSTKLLLDGERWAAMNLYARSAGLFAEVDVGMAAMFAPFMALAVGAQLDQHRVENLETALSTSRLIGTAVGVLMTRHLVTPEQAFEMLRSASTQLNRKLREVADGVVSTGELPVVPPARGARRGIGAESPGRPPTRSSSVGTGSGRAEEPPR